MISIGLDMKRVIVHETREGEAVRCMPLVPRSIIIVRKESTNNTGGSLKSSHRRKVIQRNSITHY